MVEKSPIEFILQTILISAVGLLCLLLACGVIGWALSALLGLTFAQGILIPTASLVVSIVALSADSSARMRVLLVMAVCISALVAFVTALFSLPVDWLTPLTRWESCVFVFVVTMSGVYLLVKQIVEAFDLFMETSVFTDVFTDEAPNPLPVDPPVASRGRRRNKS